MLMFAISFILFMAYFTSARIGRSRVGPVGGL